MPNNKQDNAGAMPVAEPVQLSDLVSYQDGSVVSRTLAKRNGGTVTLFAFAEGQSLSEHTAPFDALVQVLDGDAELVIGGKTVMAAAGQAVLMPANIPHAVNAPGRFKMLLVMVRQVEKN
jgi:quercetin dioxygenase-like cupin family protein